MKNTAVGLCLLALAAVLVSPAATGQSMSIVPTQSTWKYLDNGSDQGTGWRTLQFDDTSWPSGPAQLGFGEGDEATLVSQTGSSGGTNITYYFRQAFNVASLSSVTNLLLRLRRDDGAVVYLNDTEVFRSNMPPGPVTAATFAPIAAPDDGTNFYASPVNPALLLVGRNVLAVEVHQSSLTSSDVSFDLELMANVQFQPPLITITSPTNGQTVSSLHVPITTSATDADGTIVAVEFFEGGVLFATAVNAPFTVLRSNVAPGSYTFTAVAFDSTGLTATSAPVTISVPVRLVPSGSPWKYLDTGLNPGPTWVTAAFDDTSWPAGFAQLGFGDGDEATTVSRTNSAGNTNITYYFRHAFDVANPAAVSSLVVRVLRDDGCVVYLNGVEVFRDNMPNGPVTADTLATAAIDDTRFRAGRVNPALLLSGGNILGVEVHQANMTSSDVSFDLELRPNVPPTPPTISITSPTNGTRLLEPANVMVNAAGSDLDDRIANVTFRLNGNPAGTDTTEPFSVSWSNLVSGRYTALAVATDEFGNSSTSAPTEFFVVPPPIVTTLIATGSVWKYFDSGVDLGTAWHEPQFNDSAWNSGPAKLGFGDSAATIIDIGPATSRYITTYFRRHFQANNVIEITNFAFRVLRDDGCLVYLNGYELFRMNMPAGPMTFNIRALTVIGGTNEFHYFPWSGDPPWAVLQEGDNVLAVELHQSDSTTSDAGFDLGFYAVQPPPGLLPRLSITPSGSTIRITWSGSGFALQSAQDVSGPYVDLSPAVVASPYVINLPAAGRSYRLRQIQP
jgi:hypothetical protein